MGSDSFRGRCGGTLDAKLLIYQVSDKYDANEDSALSHNIIRKMDEQLKKAPRVVMYSGRKLFEEADVPHRYFLEQAVDFEHFAGEAAPADCARYRDNPRPDSWIFRVHGFRDGYGAH